MILDMPTDQEGTLKAKEREGLQELQRDGRWAHLWGVAGEYSNCSVFDVAEKDEHLLLSGLPLSVHRHQGDLAGEAPIRRRAASPTTDTENLSMRLK